MWGGCGGLAAAASKSGSRQRQQVQPQDPWSSTRGRRQPDIHNHTPATHACSSWRAQPHAPLRARVTIACASCSAASSRWMPSWPAGTSMPPRRCCYRLCVALKACWRGLGRGRRRGKGRAAWASRAGAHRREGAADHTTGRSPVSKAARPTRTASCGALASGRRARRAAQAAIDGGGRQHGQI